jgi:hypothetical protein
MNYDDGHDEDDNEKLDLHSLHEDLDSLSDSLTTGIIQLKKAASRRPCKIRTKELPQGLLVAVAAME